MSISINDDWDIGGKRVSQQRFQLAQALTSRMPRLRCQHAVEVVLYFETLIMIPPPHSHCFVIDYRSPLTEVQFV